MIVSKSQRVIITEDTRPSDLVYATLSKHVYENGIVKGDTLKIQEETWQVVDIQTSKDANDYFGVLYESRQNKQLVLAHRGTHSFGGVVEDIQGVIFNVVTKQHAVAHSFTKKAVEKAKKTLYHLSFTGHSLGALLADLSTYYCNSDFNYYDVNAVTFESPGSRDLIEKRMLPNLTVNRINLDTLNIIQYFSYPNLVNTYGNHIGTVYQIQPILNKLVDWVPGWYTKQAHSISNIAEIFEKDYLEIKTSGKGSESSNVLSCRTLMQDWPLGRERNKFFDQAIFIEGKYTLGELDNKLGNNNEFTIYYKGHYRQDPEINDKTQIFLRHVSPSMREFLRDFYRLHKHLLNESKTKSALITYWKAQKVSDKLINLILNYRIDPYKNTEITKVVSALDNKDVRVWYKKLNLQLVKNPSVIPKLLQPLHKEHTNHGTIINVTNTSLLDDDTRHFIEEIQAKYNISTDYEKLEGLLKISIKYFFDRLRFLVLLVGIIVVVFLFKVEIMQIIQSPDSTSNQHLTRSDLITPHQTAFLERPNIIQAMKKCLEGEEGIKTVALTGIVGIGGAGKTTMARHFAKQLSDTPIVWELNAETKQALVNSFYDLAYTIAITDDLKKELDFIRQIKNPDQQEKQLLTFIKFQLKAVSDWILIYDNMESFAQINHLFPHDSEQWGKGKVIITTRSEHIIETSYIKPQSIIHIDELTDNEKLILLSRILYDADPEELDKTVYDKSVKFLRDIPPFPLDVSLAAYSIKNAHVSFDKYLSHINKHSDVYDNMQTKVLKETTSYTNTRYGIISSTVEKITKVNADFRELFFFICLLDSQNISHQLLESYYSPKKVNELLYHLRKNGLLIRESYKEFDVENKAISLHRSTQEIGALFLGNTYTAEEKEFLVGNMVRAVDNFYNLCLRNKDINSIYLLLPHLNTLMTNIQSMDIPHETKNKYEIDLNLILGYINYKITKNLTLAKNQFKMVIEKDNSNHLPPSVLATLLKDLCTTYMTMNLLEEGLKYCFQSIEVCKIVSTPEIIMADNFRTIGDYYRKNNNFDKAKNYFSKALDIIKNLNFPSLRNTLAELYTQLSQLYVMYYINKKDGNLADEFGKSALYTLGGYKDLHTKSIPIPEGMSCNVARHMWKYSNILMWHYADYDKAYNYLLEAEYILKHKCPRNMHLKGRIFALLGKNLLRKNFLFEAEEKLTEGINILDVALGASTSWSHRLDRAEARIRLKKFGEAYNDCLQIFEVGHIERTNLHDLRYYMTYYHAAIAKYNIRNYQESIEYFIQFIKNMEKFCKVFLDKSIYDSMEQENVFAILPLDGENELKDIQTYLKNSLEIYSNIFGKDNSFVKDYVLKQYENADKMIESN